MHKASTHLHSAGQAGPWHKKQTKYNSPVQAQSAQFVGEGDAGMALQPLREHSAQQACARRRSTIAAEQLHQVQHTHIGGAHFAGIQPAGSSLLTMDSLAAERLVLACLAKPRLCRTCCAACIPRGSAHGGMPPRLLLLISRCFKPAG